MLQSPLLLGSFNLTEVVHARVSGGRAARPKQGGQAECRAQDENHRESNDKRPLEHVRLYAEQFG